MPTQKKIRKTQSGDYAKKYVEPLRDAKDIPHASTANVRCIEFGMAWMEYTNVRRSNSPEDRLIDQLLEMIQDYRYWIDVQKTNVVRHAAGGDVRDCKLYICHHEALIKLLGQRTQIAETHPIAKRKKKEHWAKKF